MQCAKLNCCINYEVDAYVEAQKRLPSREIVLETQDGTYYHFKTDIFKREITYSTRKSVADNIVTVPAQRAFDVINMNKKGMKPVSLEADTKQQSKREVQDILGQESVTRFDNAMSKKKKKRRSPGNNNGEANNGNAENAEKASNNANGQSPKQSQPNDKKSPENKKGNNNGANGNNAPKNANRNNRPKQKQQQPGNNNAKSNKPQASNKPKDAKQEG